MESDENELKCSGKLAFDTEKEALAVANTLKWRHGENYQTYKCADCGLWHLTSR